MSLELIAGKNALVTGAARRLGRTIAETLAEHGAGVIVHYNSSARAAAETVAAVRKHGVPARAVGADLSDAMEAEALWKEAVAAAGGRIDILVCSAALFPDDDLEELDAATLDTVLRVNTLAPVVLGRRLAGQGGGGAIVNVLDARSLGAPLRRHVSYDLSKRMLTVLTRLMAREFAPRVRVNGVAPGLVLPPPGMEEEERRRLARLNLLGRWGDPHDVARAVLFLLENDFVTGHLLVVDGGGILKGS